MSADNCSASLSLCLTVPDPACEVTADAKDVTEAIAITIKKTMKKMDGELVPLCARVFYKRNHSLTQDIIKGMSQYLN